MKLNQIKTQESSTQNERFKISYESQMQAVKHAVANSVRLCVVAPTVNVHVADEKFKLQSGWVVNIDINIDIDN